MSDGRVDPAFRADVLAGLAQPQKAVPARWLYDERGSELFEQITRLPEYYPTRTETALLSEHGADIADRIRSGGAVVEFGAGSSAKTPLLLEPLRPKVYVPVDISGEFLTASAAAIADAFPAIEVKPLIADFMRETPLPDAVAGLPLLGFFPGSTIGNLVAASAVDLLRRWRRMLGPRSQLLIGFDRVKPLDVLSPAYDDARGVTAAFNLNLIERVNRELGGDIPAGNFIHEARWHEPYTRIEMHLVARETCRFSVAGHAFAMAAGETIHTENSHKYGLGAARLLLAAGGWMPVADWSDAQDWFTLILASAEPDRAAP